MRVVVRAVAGILVALAGFLAAFASAGTLAPDHRHGCHAVHSCPSDHHTYVWVDPRTGQSWDCARPGADEYDPSRDTTSIIWDGLPYYCRAAGGTPPATTTTVATTTTTTTAPACGVERWTVKTLQDRPKLLPVKDTTVAYLVRRPAPRPLPDTRLPFERHVYRVRAAVPIVKSEDDGDLHLVLEDAQGRTMIAESPSTSCTVKATAVRRRQMADARSKITECGKADVTGVAFFDFKHGQTGVAPNGIELHPVLAFRCLSA